MDKFRQMVEAEMGSIEDMIETTFRVKGDEFGLLVLTVFETYQIAKACSVISSAEDDKTKAIAFESIERLCASIVMRQAGDLDDQATEEAFQAAMAMMRRVGDLEERMQKPGV